MKELITIATSFIIVVAFAMYMFIGNQKHTTAVMEAKELNEVVEKNRQELMQEITALKQHIHETDSIFHKRNGE